MEEKNRWGILRPGFAIENRKSVNFYCAIRHVLRHLLDPWAALAVVNQSRNAYTRESDDGIDATDRH